MENPSRKFGERAGDWQDRRVHGGEWYMKGRKSRARYSATLALSPSHSVVQLVVGGNALYSLACHVLSALACARSQFCRPCTVLHYPTFVRSLCAIALQCRGAAIDAYVLHRATCCTFFLSFFFFLLIFSVYFFDEWRFKFLVVIEFHSNAFF